MPTASIPAIQKRTLKRPLDRRQSIIQAAAALFAKVGFNDCEMQRVASRLRIAKGTLYLYYESKRDIYIAALKFGIEQMYSMVAEKLSAVSAPEDKLRTLIAVKLAYFDDNRDFFKIYYSELGNLCIHPGTIDNEFKMLYLESAKVVESILKEGARKKVIRSVRTEQAAFAISDIIRSVVTHRVLGWSKSKISQDVDFIFDLIWKGIAAS